MEINIDEVVSTVRTVSDDAVLSPKLVEQLVTAVLAAMEQRETHKERVKKEQQVVHGIRNGGRSD